MKVVSTGYTKTPTFSDPKQWLQRIDFYTGILEALAKKQAVESIEQINFEGRLEQKGVIYHFLNFSNGTKYFPFQQHRYIKKLNPDVVLVNGLIFPLQVIQLRLSLGKAVKVIILHRGEKPYRGIKGYLQKLADKMTDAYCFTSAEFGEEWIRHGNISDQKKIHEVIQASSVFFPQEKNEERNYKNNAPVFLWVGRLDRNKDPLTVVKAFLKFAVHQPAAKLFMIYQSEELLEEVKQLIGLSGLKSIELVGKVEHRQLQVWYNTADFIIAGSHHEGSGIAVCEAMSCGCIPIVTDIISFRKMTGPGHCGVLYQPGNADALLQLLMSIKNMDIAKEKAKTLQQFEEALSFSAIAGKIEKIITSLS